ncbi:hypothetical protein BN7_6300 [Wickerhamomyces ciferrii]|uniref:Arrestin C-terminal-like domain-containing protein n=1 Tax=Wickerhamomyces ciferrii (strain ATCC 14091 / BCRC 22168 / CBS 111 / JCM 3599 / NBRC 0793 / NRRL Y-1031 F-60-10) TaxID=1206466 RepID=K0KZY2_WICCF|nr:uncharacterized protein BN7_6300 [Wickerhamomyces ciferrii]CCH46703.1 hypothetical protein BN7_6300 [Wickerhamomyces ciferrii]
MLNGHLVFSLPESLTVKKIGLKLIGRYKLDFLEVMAHQRSTISSPVKQDAVVFEVTWDNLLVNSEGVVTVSASDKVTNPNDNRSSSQRHGISALSSSSHTKKTTPKKLNRANAPTALTLPINGVSGTPFENVTTPNGASFNLPGGNYDLPFKCVLPGDIPETVEGLVAGSVLYKFEASIDKGAFKSPINKYKYFRIFRTLSSDNLQLSETMQIGKTWPGKLQYEVSIPARAVPIGGKTPLNILLVPFIKAMKLGPIKAQIVQYYSFKGINGDVYDDQQQIMDLTMTQMENHELTDKLAIESSIDLPSNLKKVTQDCDLKEDLIKVRHKLKIQINIIQPNGHMSELRANLPISFYISPDEEMTGRTIVLDKYGKIHFRKEEEPLFEKNKHNQNTNKQKGQDFAPPVYEAHIYDQLYGDSSTDVSGANSGAVSPNLLSPGNLSPINYGSGGTSPNYGAGGGLSPSPTPGAVSPLPILQNQSQLEEGGGEGYFGIPTRPSNNLSSGNSLSGGASAAVSPLLEASIHNSYGHNIDDELSRSLEALKFTHISDLPSYQDAIDADDDVEETLDFAPNYENSDDEENDKIFGTVKGPEHNSLPKFGGLTSKSVGTISSASHSRTSSLPSTRVQTPKRQSPVGNIELPKTNDLRSQSSSTSLSTSSRSKINTSTSTTPTGLGVGTISTTVTGTGTGSGSGSSSSSQIPPQRPSAFRSSSLNNILSRHGSSSNLNLSGKTQSTNTSSSNLSKLAYKKFLKKDKK